MTNKCKCKGCPDRRDGCHAICESYQAYRAEKDKINKQIRTEKEKFEFAFAVSRKIRNNIRK